MPKCDGCPDCTEWSECVNGGQTQTCYRCNETTSECEPYKQTQDCKVKITKEEQPINNRLLISLIVTVIIVILLAIILPKVIKKR